LEIFNGLLQNRKNVISFPVMVFDLVYKLKNERAEGLGGSMS
jgi:hypothetical protein